MNSRILAPNRLLPFFALFIVGLTLTRAQPSPFTPEDLLNLRRVVSAAISPSGDMIAYTIERQRRPDDEAGASYSELVLFDRLSGESHPYVSGKVKVTSPLWKPDGREVAFLLKRGNRTQVWSIPVSGGEAIQLTDSEEPVLGFRWHPDGSRFAYIAQEPKTKREKSLADKGYGFVYYEENLKPRNLYLSTTATDSFPRPKQLTQGISVWSFEFSPDGRHIAVATSAKPLVDESYMSQKIHLLDIQTGSMQLIVSPPGKLGTVSFSPDGKQIAFTGAASRQDHAVSQVFTIPIQGGTPFNATPQNHPGHISWVGWKDDGTILYRSEDGVHTSYRTARTGSTESKTILTSRETGIVFDAPTLSPGSSVMAFIGKSPSIPGDLFLFTGSGSPDRLTTVNPWLSRRTLGRQSVVNYAARDGRAIEGLLIHPAVENAGTRYPLVVIVHGGPESHYSNGWLTSYSEPGQVLAGKGYMVFYPNYRASTGYGVAFAAEGFGDPAGKEFDDIADGIDYLTQKGAADRERVGLGGGSYGGYAAAWFASYYTKYVRAVVMFVGISDLVSKQSTTDIPEEELAVHAGKPLEQTWEFSLKRSPVYWAHQSSTATLICGGTDDSRVHPSQSLELYRRMKINKHPAVRLVQYPGEQHGNARQPARTDLLYRTLEWYDWYVRDAKPFHGPMPRLDISDRYGVE